MDWICLACNGGPFARKNRWIPTFDGWSSHKLTFTSQLDVRGSTVEATGVIKKWPDASCTATCFLDFSGGSRWTIYCCTVFFSWFLIVFWWSLATAALFFLMDDSDSNDLTKTWASWALWMSNEFGFLRSASGESLTDQWKGGTGRFGHSLRCGNTPQKGSSGSGQDTL